MKRRNAARAILGSGRINISLSEKPQPFSLPGNSNALFGPQRFVPLRFIECTADMQNQSIRIILFCQ
jgi:hypothetical protein